jgi:uncharacterized Ntn-hydrolase superfamily protein
MDFKSRNVIATFSIAAFDPETKQLGIAVQSKFLAVGAVVPWAKAGVGAVATQAWANIAYGPEGLDYLAQGHTAQETADYLTGKDDRAAVRQLGIVDAQGRSATFTGSECNSWAGGIAGPNFACQGNILVNEATVRAMADTFQKSKGELAQRLVDALDAAQNAGGDSRGRQSAALLIVREGGGYGGGSDREVDLRVDDHPEPILELRRLLNLHRLYFGRPDPTRRVPMTQKVFDDVEKILLRSGYLRKPDVSHEEFADALLHLLLIENFDDRLPHDNHIDLDVLEFLTHKFLG